MVPIVTPSLTTIIPKSKVVLAGISEVIAHEEEVDSFILDFTDDYVAIPNVADTIETTGATSLDISSIDDAIKQNLISSGICSENDEIPKLVVSEDNGLNAGCGGKLWTAGKLLSIYLLENLDKVQRENNLEINKIVEIGSGTGVVGLSLGLLLKSSLALSSRKIYLTDLPLVLPILSKNIRLNNLESSISAQELDWNNEKLPDYLTHDNKKCDLVLAADCVYDPRAFDALRDTLIRLSKLNQEHEDKETVILMASVKRRKCDLKFFKMLKKTFQVQEIIDYKEYEEFRQKRCHLFKIILKKKN